jgi:hypothetical protein
MADKKRATERRHADPPDQRMSTDVLADADEVVAATQAATASAPKKARRRIRKLTQELDVARTSVARRLRQSAKAQQMVDKRERQAARAAARVAAIISTIRDQAGETMSIGSAAVTSSPPSPPTPPKEAKPSQARKPTPTARPARRPAKPRSASPTSNRRPSARSPKRPPTA